MVECGLPEPGIVAFTLTYILFFFSSRRRHTRFKCDWSSDVCSSDLTTDSAVIKGLYGSDYFRSRMLCFELVIKSGRRRPWNRLYASAVFGLCKVVGKEGRLPIAMAWQQFRFGGVSGKGLAFFCAALFGQPGLRTWNRLAELRQKLRPEREKVPKNG